MVENMAAKDWAGGKYRKCGFEKWRVKSAVLPHSHPPTLLEGKTHA